MPSRDGSSLSSRHWHGVWRLGVSLERMGGFIVFRYQKVKTYLSARPANCRVCGSTSKIQAPKYPEARPLVPILCSVQINIGPRFKVSPGVENRHAFTCLSITNSIFIHIQVAPGLYTSRKDTESSRSNYVYVLYLGRCQCTQPLNVTDLQPSPHRLIGRLFGAHTFDH